MTLRTGDVNADGGVGPADLNEIRMNVGRGLAVKITSATTSRWMEM
jgi:hypothetical protein